MADHRQDRREAMRARLIAAAWSLAHEHGLAGVSQRALADRVGLAQPSLYSYFASKNDLYDAMFHAANVELVARLEALELPDDPRSALLLACRELMAYSTADPLRYQLLFQRTVPGFEPSAASYAVAVRFYEWHRQRLQAVGIRGQEHMDVFVALQAGLTEAQLANDPGGDRWSRHLDWVIEMFVDRVLSQTEEDNRAVNAAPTVVAPRRAHRDRPRRQPGLVQRGVPDQLPDGGPPPRRGRKAAG